MFLFTFNVRIIVVFVFDVLYERRFFRRFNRMIRRRQQTVGIVLDGHVRRQLVVGIFCVGLAGRQNGAFG
jgi:hypothetical protein